MNLYLIGYRGSGKSTVAPMVAEELDRETVDSDDAIEVTAQMSIAEIFSEQGEAAFREREQAEIDKISRREDLVVSLGGGAPMFESNRACLTKGKTVWLTASAEVLWNRISQDLSTAGRRPNLTQAGGLAEIESLLARRNPVYEACADYTLEVGKLTPRECADAIVHWWQTADKS